MQAYLYLRANRELPRHDVIGPDGGPLTHSRPGCERQLMTLFGKVTIRRKGYNRPGERSLFPLDGQLNLPKDQYSHGLRRRVAEEASLNSFDEAVITIDKTTGGKVPKRQLEEITVVGAQDFDAFYSVGKTEQVRQSTDILAMPSDL
jgi:hypothetical protein